MLELKDFVHWVPTPILALGFWWLLKRMFQDFEHRLSELFGKLQTTLTQQQQHDTRLQLLDQRLNQLETKRRGR